MDVPRDIHFTQHAEERCQQRGIDAYLVSVVHHYGTWRHTRQGYSCSMDARARERARRGMGEVNYRAIADQLNFYVGVAADMCTILTVAHRLKRHKSA